MLKRGVGVGVGVGGRIEQLGRRELLGTGAGTGTGTGTRQIQRARHACAAMPHRT